MPESNNEKIEAKVSVEVTAEKGVTFARKPYAKGEKINCTAAQVKILKKQGVV